MKKFISLLLAAVLLLTALPTASAVSFYDMADVKNLDAVTLMVNLGLVAGYEDGSFRPKNNIRRAEAAKLAAIICRDDPQSKTAANYGDTAANHWAMQYISYCAETGIMVGSGGRFRPNDYVTGRELAKILLVCLGYSGSKYTGAAWKTNVDADAKALGIYKDYTADPGLYISRDDACLLMYNAMQCFAVADGTRNDPIYVVDELMNPITYMEHRFRVVKFSGILEANEFADLTQNGGHLKPGMSKLAGHAAMEIGSPFSFLGRKVELYAIRTTVSGSHSYMVIGVPHLTDLSQVTTTDSTDGFFLALQYAGLNTAPSTRYYYNGDRTAETVFANIGKDCTITATDHNSDKVLDAVYITDYKNGTVTGRDPLTVTCGDKQYPAKFLEGQRPLTSGESVRGLVAGGRFLIA